MATEDVIGATLESLEKQFGRVMYAGIIDAILGVLVLMAAIPTAIALGWSYWWVSLPQILYGALCLVVGVMAFLGVHWMFFAVPGMTMMGLTRNLSVISLILSIISLIEIIASGIVYYNFSTLLLSIFPIVSIIINFYIAKAIDAIKLLPFPT